MAIKGKINPLWKEVGKAALGMAAASYGRYKNPYPGGSKTKRRKPKRMLYIKDKKKPKTKKNQKYVKGKTLKNPKKP